MSNAIRNVLLLAAALILSYLTAPYFGLVYDWLFPSELNSGWIGGSQSLEFIRGVSLSLIFFLVIPATLLFKNKNRVLWLISPILLWEVTVDIRHIYIPILLALIAFGLAILLRRVLKIGI